MFKQYLIALFLSLSLLNAHAAVPVPAPPSIDATGYLLIDMNSDRILVEKNADQRLEPASITKIMTAHVVFHELQKDHLKLQ